MRIREDRQRAEEERRRQEQERREEEMRRREEVEQKRREEARMEWRRWTRRVVVGDGVSASASSTGQPTNSNNTLRIAIRLPSGARIIHTFASSSPLTALYALVDAHLTPPQHPASEDPLSPPGSKSSSKEQSDPISTLDSHILTYPAPHTASYWGFLVLSAYPRAEIPWAQHTPLSDVKALRGGGQVVVELLREKGKEREGTPRSSLSSERGGGIAAGGAAVGEEEEDDGYHTEDSE